MSTANDDLTRAALDQAERSRKATIMWFAVAGVWEAACLVAFILIADWSDRTHWLLLVTAFLIYGTLAFGLLTLGAYLRLCTLRVLKSVELLDDARAA